MADIKSMIAKKQSAKENKNLMLNDINHDLIVSLFAVSVYGKPARDEEILEIIIGGPKSKMEQVMDELRKCYEEKIKRAGKVTRKKNGQILDQNGFIILKPR